jgi:metallo-beta-lactamase class B
MGDPVILTLLALAAVTQPASIPPEWKEPVEPFRIAGSIHYIGTADLASYLFTTPAGHILLDTPGETETPLLLESIRKRASIRKTRGSCSIARHFDHTGALRALRAG